MPSPKPIEVFGVRYQSLTSACKAFGHREPKVRHRMTAQLMTLEEALVAENRYDGSKSHPSYSCWNAMLSRCHSNSECGKNYRDKGIIVCDSWRNNFWNFVADMGCRPSKLHTVDRIDNKKGYEPGNCRWATMKQQCENKRTTIRFAGYPSLADAAKANGISADTLSYRIKRGLSDDAALSLPPRGCRNFRKLLGVVELSRPPI